MYSVPPTLIGRQVTVRLHDDRLVVFLGSDWVCQLPRAAYNLPQTLERLDRYPLLLIDGIGYERRDKQESSVLFELIYHRYERLSLLITANQTFTAWGEIFPRSLMPVAAVDRLVHYCHIVEISSDSHRRADADRRAGRQRKQPGQGEETLTRGANLAPINAAPGGVRRLVRSAKCWGGGSPNGTGQLGCRRRQPGGPHRPTWLSRIGQGG
jgi:hypothetical protein